MTAWELAEGAFFCSFFQPMARLRHLHGFPNGPHRFKRVFLDAKLRQEK